MVTSTSAAASTGMSSPASDILTIGQDACPLMMVRRTFSVILVNAIGGDVFVRFR